MNDILTQRERDIVALIATGATNEQIARALGIRAKTVTNVLTRVYAKTQTGSRTDLAVRLFADEPARASIVCAALSARQTEILTHVARGMTNKQVAFSLNLAEKTVRNQMTAILRKLGTVNRTQAVLSALPTDAF